MRNKRAFTLVELLIAITILGLLASLVLVALASATESAKEARTRATIAKINAVVMAKWESYRTRRVPINIPPGTDPRTAARARLDGLRELMRMEVPDRLSDIQDDPVTPATAGGTNPKMERPAVSYGYQSILSGATPNTTYQGAEGLYMFVMRGSYDPDVSEQFSTTEQGDVDGDGLKEFLDGWGRPISFVRWAPGFVSSLQPQNPTDHDPFDPLKVQANTFPLYPLIFSAGPDGQYEVNNDASHSYAGNNNDPYVLSIGEWRDADGDGADGRLDNITNHE